MSTARFKGFSGPIGSGKSQALCHEAIKLSYSNPGRMGLLGAPTYPMLRDATQATLFEILDQNKIPYEHNKGENTLVLRESGSKIVFRAVEEFERLRGTNLAWFGVDELTYAQEDSWTRLEGRLRDPCASRLCGFAVWTPKGYDWVYRRFLADNSGAYDTIVAKAFENKFLLDKIPDFYERLQRSYDPTFYQQEVLGEYLNLTGGKVYSAFARQDHMERSRVDPAEPLLWALDFNYDPMCAVVAQVQGEKTRVVDEICLSKASTGDACEVFLKRYGRHRALVEVYGDCSGFHIHTNTGASDYDLLREYVKARSNLSVKYRVPKRNPAVRERVNVLNAHLRTSSGDIRLLIDPKCEELIKDLEQVAWKEDGKTIDKDKDSRRTHLSDALGYLLFERQFGSKTGGERAERLL